MDLISFRCTSCKQGLKIGADKAGRKIKCTKCGTELIIPRSSQEEPKPAPAPQDGPQLVAEAPPKAVEEEEEEDDKKGYGLFVDPNAAAEEEKKKLQGKPKKEEKKKAAPLKRKFKTLTDPDLWEKVKGGLQILMIGPYIWGGVLLFTVLIMMLGFINGPDYSEVLENAMTVKTDTPAGEVVTPDMPTFMLGLVVGTGYQGIGKIFYILAVLLSICQIIVMMAGYAVCLKVPDRQGMKGQLLGLLSLGGVNLLLILVFKLLPALGVLNYVMIPYAVPEVSMIDANVDRDPPLWVNWSGAPFWEMMLTVVFVCCVYAEPVLLGVFIWTIGTTLKEEPIIEKGQAVVALAFGIGFALLSFHLLSMTGTSGVALGVLRVLYIAWIGFTIFLLVRIPMALLATRAILQKYLDGAALSEDKEEGDDEDEEEEKKPKRKRKAKRSKDEDEEDDDD